MQSKICLINLRDAIAEEGVRLELIFILIIIAIFICVLTGNLGYILFAASGFLMIIAGLLILIFAVCSLLLLGSKWKEARFVRLDLPTDKAKFKVAYYLVDGEEIPCLFPEEGIFVKLFYRTDRKYHVLYHEKLGRVFDRFSIATCVVGVVCGTLLEVMLIALYF